jgi:hypothetical protein
MDLKMNNRSNVINFLPPMTFNKNFITNFVEESTPCATLGIVEIAGQQKGFLAFKADKVFSESVGQNGFELGSELLGTDEFAVLHLILNFDTEHIYDVFLNLNSPVVKNVLKVWERTNDHFFFAFRENGLTAFDQTLGEAWHNDNYFRITEKATNTISQYEKAVDTIKNSDMLHGNYLDMIFQDKVEYLNLNESRFEVQKS